MPDGIGSIALPLEVKDRMAYIPFGILPNGDLVEPCRACRVQWVGRPQFPEATAGINTESS